MCGLWNQFSVECESIEKLWKFKIWPFFVEVLKIDQKDLMQFVNVPLQSYSPVEVDSTF